MRDDQSSPTSFDCVALIKKWMFDHKLFVLGQSDAAIVANFQRIRPQLNKNFLYGVFTWLQTRSIFSLNGIGSSFGRWGLDPMEKGGTLKENLFFFQRPSRSTGVPLVFLAHVALVFVLGFDFFCRSTLWYLKNIRWLLQGLIKIKKYWAPD